MVLVVAGFFKLCNLMKLSIFSCQQVLLKHPYSALGRVDLHL